MTYLREGAIRTGRRRIVIEAKFLEQLLTMGVAAASPTNVPKDLRVESVRLVGQRVEVLVSSSEFEGAADDSWGAPVWYPVFKKAGA